MSTDEQMKDSRFSQLVG